ncbi:response regulator [Candidatus Magnetominusculus dajiuhuensis]|uniref:response regulator n=1 Tax=Candidatus Magnetominusculus dajiuhuensis TaxID=3137712 RepID=UPI003B43802F
MRNGKVLVIDDEYIVRVSCQRVLEAEGYVVFLSANAADGLKLIEDEGPDLVITDLIMPGMDGFELLKLVRDRWPSLRVVVMTGYGTTEAANKSLELGADGFIKKPFLPEELLSIASTTRKDYAY